ncbi:MAG: carbohydrate ABC transporter permease [Firmicutes bacterium]|nr:carbohydrate ABC transporter permease [Bacillota bacterium]
MKMAVIKESKGDRVFNAINITVVTLFFLIVLYPLYFVVICSFSNPNAVAAGEVWFWPKQITLDAYKTVFKNDDILMGYRNTIFYTVVGTIVNLFFTLTAAYALSKKNFMGRNVIMFLIVFTMYFSGGMIPTYLTVRDLGLLNTWWAMILPAGISTYNLIIARTFFQNGVPAEVEEAARIDGCSTIQTFAKIVLPLSKALLGVLTLYYAVAHWNSYFSALIYLASAREKIPLALVLREILILNTMNSAGGASIDEELAVYYANLANLLKYALIIVSSAPLLIVYPFLQKYFDKGVMLGSVKG